MSFFQSDVTFVFGYFFLYLKKIKEGMACPARGVLPFLFENTVSRRGRGLSSTPPPDFFFPTFPRRTNPTVETEKPQTPPIVF